MSNPAPSKDQRELLKRALLKIDDLQARLDRLNEPIAVIGLGCRFPNGANDPESFWQLLREGVDGITEIPPERWNVDAYYDPDPSVPGKMYTRRAGFIEGVDLFDPQFFGIAPREAVSMDPQQRLLLEVTWEALEHAGQAPAKLAGSRTGVYIGISGNDYSHLQSTSGSRDYIDTYFGAGVAHSIASGRISYLLGLQGPSVSVDTACSASLTALHLACQSLRLGESDLALAGGVNVILSPDGIITASQARMLSPDGRCKTFDASADGYVRAEGCGMVVLKRLSDALANHDHILALIHGTAANQDGRSSGLTAPNTAAQQAVIRAALERSGLQPSDISYLETHGTGTALGDPIEVQSLGAVFGADRSPAQPLLIGAVKSNIGHLEAAAGIAGFIKTVLALQHRELPPSLHVRHLNPYIAWDKLPIKVVTTAMPWSLPPNQRRLAGVSSFGFSGTNVHVILEEAPARPPAAATNALERPRHVLTLSAKSEAALQQLASRYQHHLAEHPTAALPDICFTANAGRSHFTHRLALTAATCAQARELLAAFCSGQVPPGVQVGQVDEGQRPGIAFLFTGQGAQYPDMGRQLYETQPVFRAALEECDALLRPHLEKPLLSVLFRQPSAALTDNWLDQTAYTQPALFAIEYALAELWRAWGVQPAVVMGHSVGEYVAACVAGVFSLADGLKLIAARGRLMQALPPNGTMVAVFAGEALVRAALAPYAGRVDLGAINGPNNIVISGEAAAVAALVAQFEQQGIKSRPLTVSHAFHSPLMEPMLDEFERIAAEIAYAPPRIGLISNLTGKLVAEDEVTNAQYWRRHVRGTVRFAEAMTALPQQGCCIFLEIGPRPTLLSMGQRCLPEGTGLWLPSLRPGRDDWETMLDSLASLYVHGVNVDWARFDRDYARQRVILPTYPFQRSRYWAKAAELGRRRGARRMGQEAGSEGQATGHPLLGARLRSALKEVQFENEISLTTQEFLREHRFYGTAVFPATAYVEMALAAAAEVSGAPPAVLEQVNIHEALLLPEDQTAILQTILTPLPGGKFAFQMFSMSENGGDGKWRLHAEGMLLSGIATPTAGKIGRREILARCPIPFAVDAYYRRFSELGVDYGPGFRGLTAIQRGEGEALGHVQLPAGTVSDEFHLHPALLDACLQLLGAAAFDERQAAEQRVYMPAGFERLRVHLAKVQAVWCHARLRPGGNEQALVCDLHLFEEDGTPVASLEGLRCKRVTPAALQRLPQKIDDWFYEIHWQPQTLAEMAAPAAAPQDRPGVWLILAGADGAGKALAECLEQRRQTCILVSAGEKFTRRQPNEWCVNPAERADFERLLQESGLLQEVNWRGVVHLWGLTAGLEEKISAEVLQQNAQFVCGSALALVQAMAGAKLAGAPRLWLVTAGAQSLDGDAAPPAAAQMPLWGLGNVIALEHPALQCRRVDLEAGAVLPAMPQLAEECLAEGAEDQIAWRRGRRFVARLRRAPMESHESRALRDSVLEERPVKLEIPRRGILENLQLVPLTRRPPQRGEVEIRVLATGLNFRDVLNALGMYPGDPGPLGNECVGRITAVGDGVTDLAVGDEVMALAADTFATYVTTDAAFVVPKPAPLSLEEAATLPITFLTAYHALLHLGKMRAGERVLIHAAAGGVGLAAVQLAQRAGAEIFATAGSPEKHAHLRALGVQHIFSSRTLDFAERIRQLTNGEGVDLVLNSLAGEFIPRSLALLRRGGRFLEIGKTDVWNADRVKALYPEVSYHVIYLGETVRQQPALIRRQFLELYQAFTRGELKPLPVTSFPLAEAVSAYRFMAQARHIGKVVLTQPEQANGKEHGASDKEQGAGGRRQGTIDERASYLITGGLGALGLHVARWMVEQGARHVVLVGRSAPSPEAARVIAEMEQTGAQITIARGDISREDEVWRIVADITPPLRGIVHAAGVLADGVLLQQEWSRFARVLAPKMNGAWHLHRATRHLPLDFFVMFSSIAALFGATGQGNYAAANAFLDGLAHYRRRQGLPALSINWGAWAEGGMVTSLGKRGEHKMSGTGLSLIAPEQGVQALARLLASDRTQVVVMPIAWQQFLQRFAPGQEPPFYAEMARQTRIDPKYFKAPEQAVTILQALEKATPAERLELLTAHVREQVVKVLGLEGAPPPGLHQGLTDLGMDSLMAVELSNRLRASFGKSLPSTLAFEHPTIAALTQYLATEVLAWETASEAAAPDAGNGGVPAVAESLANLSGEELEESLLKELEGAGY
ncbi:MAG: type I polyketide synthase [candidate division KSB1 bacterium]|nr:type I polyketide synthase [candidate division KSB1 bacterium]MDZ7275822.1 type I polyketide synthase [candidate division KSB1 bacterium]MDZ7287572.1 type I polyketide synthase [candidate division KSB1 bacterium]MDZ7308297.1 type I polyketide synthase [candidate division KSB1 bacterium]MDZ7350550.1 type I polyketide synthase [candidate division KSB1 bacterium]